MIGNPIVGFTFAPDEVWHPFFSLKGEIPMVGDFNGDGNNDIVTFTQKQQRRADGTIIGPAPVWVAVSNRSAFVNASVWHTFFSLKGEIPLAGDFNGDGKKDIITFTQTLQRNADGSVLGQAPVWVALSTGTSFGGSRVWHTFFSLKGEIPMVGDFNGDGKDDIATFVQKPHRDAAGNVIAQAPVWVALSDGTRFGQSRIWHNFFAPTGELPRIGDLNMDGKADIVTFLQGKGQGVQTRNVYTAFSNGSRFETSTMLASDQVRKGDLPYFGTFTATTLGDFTQHPNDSPRLIPDLYIFEPNGTTRIAHAMRQIPFPTGAPWERYKWFTEKGLGAAAFPEWIYETGPNHCLTLPFRFVLTGAGGSGGPGTMVSSVRSGGRAEHILEELGHTLFANCMLTHADPFNIFKLIYETSMSAGGLDANNMPGCESFDDCRDPEHFFLQLIKRYRLHGDEFRELINNTTDPAVANRRRAQYLWLKQHWYRRAEFKSGPSSDPIVVKTHGLLCLPGECAIGPPPPPRCCPPGKRCCGSCETGRCDDVCIGPGQQCP